MCTENIHIYTMYFSWCGCVKLYYIYGYIGYCVLLLPTESVDNGSENVGGFDRYEKPNHNHGKETLILPHPLWLPTLFLSPLLSLFLTTPFPPLPQLATLCSTSGVFSSNHNRLLRFYFFFFFLLSSLFSSSIWFFFVFSLSSTQPSKWLLKNWIILSSFCTSNAKSSAWNKIQLLVLFFNCIFKFYTNFFFLIII